MQNKPQPSTGGSSEHNERTLQQVAIEMSTVEANEERLLIDYLIETGFVWEEATKLLHLREHLYENTEVRQRLADDNHMQFARWLYEQGAITETKT